MIDGLLKVIQGWVKVKGGTDGEIIGNVGDRLKVTGDGEFNSRPPTFQGNIYHEDMGPSTGGVSRGTAVGSTWVTVYSYSGDGIFYGFFLTMENNSNVFYRLTVDGVDLLNGSTGLSSNDMKSSTLYHLKGVNSYRFNGLHFNGDTFYCDYGQVAGIKFNSSVAVRVRRSINNTDFYAGLATIVKF